MTVCKINGKIYIGQKLRTPEESINYIGSGLALRNAIRKHGRKNFTKVILVTCSSQEELDAYEELYIELYSSTEGKIGYNILYGSAQNFGKINPMQIPSVVEKRKGRVTYYSGEDNGMFGKTHTEETRKLMSIARQSYVRRKKD